MADPSGGPAPSGPNLHALGLLNGSSGGGSGGGSAAAQGIEASTGGPGVKMATKALLLMDASNTEVGSYLGGNLGAPASSLSAGNAAPGTQFNTKGVLGLDVSKFFQENFTGEIPDHLGGLSETPVDSSGGGGGGEFTGGGGGSSSGDYEPATGAAGGGGGDDFRFLAHNGNFEAPAVSFDGHTDSIPVRAPDVPDVRAGRGMEMDF